MYFWSGSARRRHRRHAMFRSIAFSNRKTYREIHSRIAIREEIKKKMIFSRWLILLFKILDKCVFFLSLSRLTFANTHEVTYACQSVERNSESRTFKRAACSNSKAPGIAEETRRNKIDRRPKVMPMTKELFSRGWEGEREGETFAARRRDNATAADDGEREKPEFLIPKRARDYRRLGGLSKERPLFNR